MSSRAEVAVVGYGARLPGARTAEAFWSLLRDNRCSVNWVTPDRFPTSSFYHPSPDQSGKSYTFAAGVIDDIWGFDAGAFGMSPREAEQVDPQQRHLLEVTYDALAHAGIKPTSLAGSHTGVYVGASSVDYGARFFADPSAADVHMMTGNTLSIISNRLSYNLNLHGPSFTVDTACSSSLVALSLAADAIRNGTVDTAIVSGVNLLLSPFSFVGFSRASMLSPTGLCRPFDAAADGYVRAEGVIVLVLRSMAAARQARNRVHAAIVGSAVGQDGRTTGLSLPSPESQRRILEQVYSDFSIDPNDLSFVEAHGTGTRVGDPIEADALGKGLAQKRSQPLPIGSVKSNVGHLEPASGLAGVLKSILALGKGVVPATLHQQSPNTDIPFDELNLRVIGQNWRLPERRSPHLTGVNSFGFGGTNAHVILRGDDGVVSVLHKRTDRPTAPLLLNAHAAAGLAEVAASYLEQWPADRRVINDYVLGAAHQRDLLSYRALIRGDSVEELKFHAEQFARGEETRHTLTGQALGTDLPVALLFSGNGSQWAGMGRVAWQSDERFRDALRDIDERFAKRQTWSIVDMLGADDLPPRLRRATYAQPLILALQVATVRVLEESGLTFGATLGHSVGEIAAAWAAGYLSLEQAIDVVIARSRHQEQACGSGSMAAVMLGERDARRLIETTRTAGVDIAAINSWRSVTVSGPTAEIERFIAAATDIKVSARKLDLDYPFHSSLVEPVRGPLLRELNGLQPLAGRKRLVSSVTGAYADREHLGADHWWHNVRDPVQFKAGLKTLMNDGFKIFVEVGPRPILASYVRDTLRQMEVRGATIETLTESSDEEFARPIERAVSRVLLAGGYVDFNRFFGPPPVSSVPQPLYPWRHSQYVVRPTAEASSVFAVPSNPLLGLRPRPGTFEWFSTVDTALFPWIADHTVGGVAVFPATAYVEVMLAAAREIHPEGPLELRDFDIVRPLMFDGHSSFETSVRVAQETGLAEFLSRPRSASAEWMLNARGIIGKSPSASKTSAPLIPPPGTVVVPKAKVYEASAALGFGYGLSFQRARHVAVFDSKQAVATLEPLPGKALENRTIDVTGFDAAFHCLFASEEAGVADMPMKRMLPVRFGQVRVYAQSIPVAYAVARTVRRSRTSIVSDIDLLDSEGHVVIAVQNVRLIEAPTSLAPDSRSLSYRTTDWQLDRPGHTSSLRPLPWLEGGLPFAVFRAGDSVTEALLLLEAGCLRVAWSTLRRLANEEELSQDDDAQQPAAWAPFLRSALVWHLETRGLLEERDGRRVLAATCDLPELRSLVRSLIARHPTMAGEAAELSRLEEVLGRLLSGEPGEASDLESPHWRQLCIAADSVALLREAVLRDVSACLEKAEPDRLLRLLFLGADQVAAAVDLTQLHPDLEIVVTDIDVGRVEQARALLGDDKPNVRCLSWSELDQRPAGTIDLACAINSLCEIAAAKGGLGRISRLLRPKAPMVVGELAPNAFWDIVRGASETWWARSANAEFPVGALLTGREWIDELESAGFGSVTSRPVLGQEHAGVVIQALSPDVAVNDLPVTDPSVFTWEGTQATDSAGLLGRLAQCLSVAHIEAHQKVGREPPPTKEVRISVNDNDTSGTDTGGATDWIHGIRADDSLADCEVLSRRLIDIADRCRQIAGSAARMWVIVDFGDDDMAAPAAHPLWTALTAAMRVAQNEFSAIELRCIGFAGAPTPAAVDQVADELRAPTDEREIYFQGQRRLVTRIERGATEAVGPPALDHGQGLTLTTEAGGARGALVWSAITRTEPGPGEVEIEVAATGLNFRDVMWNLRLLPEEALEDGYAGPRLGMECAGTVLRVGPEVQELQPGDPVVAFVPGAFASHVIAPAFAVSRLPQELTFEAAATIPVAFLTAYYSLVHLAHLKAGQTVLVQGGAGAVGLAALQVAKHLGARVIATAGTDEKRALLRNLGADAVFNSRTLAFADDVMALTDGKGVDVVLNSLAGEAMVRSMDCLKPFGRFIELGKRDYYTNTHIGLRPFRRNLSYFGVDVDQLLGEHQDLTRSIFNELLALFARGKLTPLPYRVFEGQHIDDAFRLMQRSGHIGKIVVRPARQPTDREHLTGRFPVSAEGVHVVFGGTSGFGMATAEWLVDRGARHLVLASRSGRLADDVTAKVERLRELGANVEVAVVDVTDAKSLDAFFARQSGRPIKGIVHAAMAIDDRLIENLDVAAIEKVLRPKVAGAVNLDRLTLDMHLDYLLLYSSATTLLGNPGQYNYVAANAYLEGFARRRVAQGRPALAVAWGAIEDTGYLSRNIGSNASLRKRFATSLISARQALDGLDWAYDRQGGQRTACCSIARIDWAMAKKELVATRSPSFSPVLPAAGARQGIESTAIIEKLRGMPLEQATAALLDIIVEEIARVLRLPPKEVDRHRALGEIGMDSLMMLELRATVESALQIDLPMMSLANGITPADVARRIAPLVLGEEPKEAVPGHLVALGSSHFAEEAGATLSEQRVAAARAVMERSQTLQGPL